MANIITNVLPEFVSANHFDGLYQILHSMALVGVGLQVSTVKPNNISPCPLQVYHKTFTREFAWTLIPNLKLTLCSCWHAVDHSTLGLLEVPPGQMPSYSCLEFDHSTLGLLEVPPGQTPSYNCLEAY